MRKVAGGVVLGAALYWMLPTILVLFVVLGCLAYIFSDQVKESNA